MQLPGVLWGLGVVACFAPQPYVQDIWQCEVKGN